MTRPFTACPHPSGTWAHAWWWARFIRSNGGSGGLLVTTLMYKAIRALGIRDGTWVDAENESGDVYTGELFFQPPAINDGNLLTPNGALIKTLCELLMVPKENL